MDKIAMVKKEIQLQNWSDKELVRQESGLTVTEWCRREKISKSAYYYRLRRIRENLCEQIPVPVTELTDCGSAPSCFSSVIPKSKHRVPPNMIPSDNRQGSFFRYTI